MKKRIICVLLCVLTLSALLCTAVMPALAAEETTAQTEATEDSAQTQGDDQTSSSEENTAKDSAQSSAVLQTEQAKEAEEEVDYNDEGKALIVKDATFTQESGNNYLFSVTLANKRDAAVSDTQFIISNYDDDTLTFAEDEVQQSYNAYYEVVTYPVAFVGEIGPGATKTVTFHVKVASDGTKLDSLSIQAQAAYIAAGNEVNGGTGLAYERQTFDNILEKEPEPSKLDVIKDFLSQTGFSMLKENWKMLVMLLISFLLIFLAIVKKFEPLLLLPIAFGMLLTNLPGAEMFHEELFANGHIHWELFNAAENFSPGLIDYLYLGVKLGLYPCLIFLGVGAMTDFGPMLANPKSLLLGAAAQLGIFVTFVGAKLLGFTSPEAASIGIIGGADGPTAIYLTTRLAPWLLGPIAVAAYSYMALVPVIQPPIMKLLTTKKERQIVMKPLRTVSKREKILFPIIVTVFVALLVPSATPLVGSLMLGNLFRESGVVDRLSKTVQNELNNIVVIFLGVSVGATATADTFLSLSTIKIICMGVVAFGLGTAGGVLLAKFMNLFLKNKINPLIGSAGVSAVPMAARVSQVVGQKENPSNFLLMHAMGPNVAGVIGSALAAGALLALFG